MGTGSSASPMIDYVHPLKIVDVYPDGRREPAEVTR
jgi:hypothetical protein